MLSMRETMNIINAGLMTESSNEIEENSPFEWTRTGDDFWIGEFKAKGTWFNVLCQKYPEEHGGYWDFSFQKMAGIRLMGKGYSAEEVTALGGHINTYRPSGANNGAQFRIYSTVGAALIDFINKVSPEKIKVKGATKPQIELYRILIPKFLTRVTGYMLKQGFIVKGVAKATKKKATKPKTA